MSPMVLEASSKRLRQGQIGMNEAKYIGTGALKRTGGSQVIFCRRWRLASLGGRVNVVARVRAQSLVCNSRMVCSRRKLASEEKSARRGEAVGETGYQKV